MASFFDALPLEQRLALAVRSNRPHGLARAFAQYAGQFYDRGGFDRLAREARALYAGHSAADADAFRSVLDARLSERARPRVAWDRDHAA
jgi:hypothetical protein